MHDNHERIKYNERYSQHQYIKTSKRAGTDNVILSKVNIYVSVSCFCIPESRQIRQFLRTQKGETKIQKHIDRRKIGKIIKLITRENKRLKAGGRGLRGYTRIEKM